MDTKTVLVWNPGPNHRLVSMDEMLIEGDEVHTYNKDWSPIFDSMFGERINGPSAACCPFGCYRRPL